MRSALILFVMMFLGFEAGAVFCVSAHRFDRGVNGVVTPRMNAARLKDKTYKTTEFRSLQEAWLENVAPLGARKDLFRATIQGHAVIGKKLPDGNLKEAAWLQELNAIGLGPKLHGLVQRGNDTFFVMADVGGINTQVALLAPSGFKLNTEVMNEMKRQLGVLLENGVYPFDIQFQVSADRKKVVLIDPEMFQMREPGPSLDLQGRMALETIFLNWRMDDRVED